jgi:hypothetical protein
LISWRLGDGTVDDFGGLNPAGLVNCAAFATGKVRQAFRLDGKNDCIAIPDSANFNFPQFTIEGWFKVSLDPAENFILAGKYENDDDLVRGWLSPGIGFGGLVVFQTTSASMHRLREGRESQRCPDWISRLSSWLLRFSKINLILSRPSTDDSGGTL